MALRVGYRLCIEGGSRYVVTLDADGQNDPAELGGPAGARSSTTRPTSSSASRRLGVDETSDRIRQAGVRFFAWLMNALTGSDLTDTSNGYRALRTDAPGRRGRPSRAGPVPDGRAAHHRARAGLAGGRAPDGLARAGLWAPPRRAPTSPSPCATPASSSAPGGGSGGAGRSPTRSSGSRSCSAAGDPGLVVDGLQAPAQLLGQLVDAAAGHPAALAALGRGDRLADRPRGYATGLGNLAPLGIATSEPPMPTGTMTEPVRARPRKAAPSKQLLDHRPALARALGEQNQELVALQHLLGVAHGLAVGRVAVHREGAEVEQQVAEATGSSRAGAWP